MRRCLIAVSVHEGPRSCQRRGRSTISLVLWRFVFHLFGWRENHIRIAARGSGAKYSVEYIFCNVSLPIAYIFYLGNVADGYQRLLRGTAKNPRTTNELTCEIVTTCFREITVPLSPDVSTLCEESKLSPVVDNAASGALKFNSVSAATQPSAFPAPARRTTSLPNLSVFHRTRRSRRASCSAGRLAHRKLRFPPPGAGF